MFGEGSIVKGSSVSVNELICYIAMSSITADIELQTWAITVFGV